MLLFIAVGSVPAGAGEREGQWIGVADTWWDFSRQLPRVGHATLLQIVFDACVVLLLTTVLGGLWLSMTVGTDETSVAVEVGRESA